jgi:putative phosphoribosyl transferase
MLMRVGDELMIATSTKQAIALDGVRWINCPDRYIDRFAAGHQLAERLHDYRGSRAIVLAVAPGGVAVAEEVARMLRLPLDILMARELRVLPYPAVVAGALSEAGGLCLNRAALRLPGMSLQAVWREARLVQDEIALLVQRYRGGHSLPNCTRRAVILVDDGLGSGLVQLAALQTLRRFHPQQCIVATPWGTTAAQQRVAGWADVLVALASGEDEPTDSVFHWWSPLGDDDAVALLEQCRQRGAAAQPRGTAGD